MFPISLAFFDSDSDEEEKEQDSVILRKRRRVLRDSGDFYSLSEKEFRKRFRVSKKAFQYILETIRLPCGERSTRLTPKMRLALCLELLGTGGYQWVTGNDYMCPVNQGTLSTTFSEVLKKMEEVLCPLWIKFDPSNECKEYFYEKFNIPGVIGLVDGTHIMMLRPSQDEHTFYNRKGLHSINAMIITDHMGFITAINAQFGGCSHDSFVWSQSNERNFLEQKREHGTKNEWLLGDSGYPLEPWILTPYRKSQPGGPEEHFNKIHSVARSGVERDIGIYKGRWRILLDERQPRYAPEKLARIINVTAALHNICIYFNVPFDLQPANPDDSVLHVNCDNEPASNLKKQAEKSRDNIKNILSRQ